MLTGKKIVLGVSGSIAAYKSAILTRLLVKAGAEIRVVMTPAAHDFITPLTLSTLSRHPVLTNFVQGDEGQWNNHVELGLWADLLVIAPASANTIAKVAQGISDTLLVGVYLSARCPVCIAPAMDLDMLQHQATQDHLRTLRSRGHHLIDPAFGELASGLVGNGRMAEPEEILAFIEQFFLNRNRLKGKKALVTAGPTHEAIDPVRFIGNNSSGKMGFAIAETLADFGADVDLVSGPTSLTLQRPNVKLQQVTSAEEMYNACRQIFPSTDITVLSAAVADYKPVTVAGQKIKKSENPMTLELARTTDIAAELGKLKRSSQLMVGFALETENEVTNAQSKLEAKNFDLVVLNSLNDTGAGFGHDTNKIAIIDRKNGIRKYNLKSKKEVAGDIVNAIIEHSHV